MKITLSRRSWKEHWAKSILAAAAPFRLRPLQSAEAAGTSKHPGTKFTHHVARTLIHWHGQVVFPVFGHAVGMLSKSNCDHEESMIVIPAFSANLKLFACQRKREFRNEARIQKRSAWECTEALEKYEWNTSMYLQIDANSWSNYIIAN